MVCTRHRSHARHSAMQGLRDGVSATTLRTGGVDTLHQQHLKSTTLSVFLHNTHSGWEALTTGSRLRTGAHRSKQTKAKRAALCLPGIMESLQAPQTRGFAACQPLPAAALHHTHDESTAATKLCTDQQLSKAFDPWKLPAQGDTRATE
jgi:hypothetical protein